MTLLLAGFGGRNLHTQEIQGDATLTVKTGEYALHGQVTLGKVRIGNIFF